MGAEAFSSTGLGIGREAVIMPGVRVGDGAIIGTRAQVTKDVPPYAVVAGNPGRIVKMRFPPEIVAELLAIRWWDWEAEKIARHVDASDLVGVEGFERIGAGLAGVERNLALGRPATHQDRDVFHGLTQSQFS